MNRTSEICGTTSNVYLRIYIYKKGGVREEPENIRRNSVQKLSEFEEKTFNFKSKKLDELKHNKTHIRVKLF